MLTKQEQEKLKQEIRDRIMIQCDCCRGIKFKKEFSYINTYLGNICMECQEQDNY